MINKVFFAGNLTRDPESRYTTSGKAVCDVQMAANKRYKTQTGEQREEVCFVNVSMFGATAENCGKYLKKGSRAHVEGELVLEQWEDKSGNKRSTLKIRCEKLTFLDRAEKSQDSQNKQPSRSIIDDDDIPM